MPRKSPKRSRTSSFTESTRTDACVESVLDDPNRPGLRSTHSLSMSAAVGGWRVMEFSFDHEQVIETRAPSIPRQNVNVNR